MAPENDQPHTNDAGAVLLAASQVVGVRIHGSHALVLGVVKARYTRQRPVWAGLEFLVVVTPSNRGRCGSWFAPAWRMSLTLACLPSRVQVELWPWMHAIAIHRVPRSL